MVTPEERERAYELERQKGLRDQQARRADASAAYEEAYKQAYEFGLVGGPIQLLEELLGLETTPFEQLETLKMPELRAINAYLTAKYRNRSKRLVTGDSCQTN